MVLLAPRRHATVERTRARRIAHAGEPAVCESKPWEVIVSVDFPATPWVY